MVSWLLRRWSMGWQHLLSPENSFRNTASGSHLRVMEPKSAIQQESPAIYEHSKTDLGFRILKIWGSETSFRPKDVESFPLQMSMLKLREAKQLVQGHTAYR